MKSALHTLTLLTLLSFTGLTACGTQESAGAPEYDGIEFSTQTTDDNAADEESEETRDEHADEEESYNPDDHEQPDNSLELSDKLDVGEEFSGINSNQENTDSLDRADALDQRATFGN